MRDAREAARQVALLLGAVAGAAGCYWAARFGLAELLSTRNDLAAVDRAIRLAPGNSALHRWRAALLAVAGSDTAAVDREIERTIALNPRDSSALIELGLHAETRGDATAAERHFRQAAIVSAEYDPRWTLVNFYFRRQDWERFWEWAPQACQIAYGGRTALFRLYWETASDENTILKRGIPDDPDSLRDYLGYLLGTPHWRAAAGVAHRIVVSGLTEADGPTLLGYCDRFLAAGLGADALAVWNAMARAGLVPYRELDPRRGPWLTNAGFTEEPRNAGFDWRLVTADGVSLTRDATEGAVRVTLSGTQPEASDLLRQYIPLAGDCNYKFTFEYRTVPGETGSGLWWRVAAPGGEQVATGLELPLTREWSRAGVRIRTRAGDSVAMLGMAYRRPSGSARLEGSIWLRRLALRPETP